MNTILKLLLSLSLGGSLMALLLLGIKLLFKSRLPSSFYYYAWLLVLLRFLLPLPGFMPLEQPAPAEPTAIEPAYTYDAASPREDGRQELPAAEYVADTPVYSEVYNDAQSVSVPKPDSAEPQPHAPGTFERFTGSMAALLKAVELPLLLWAAGAICSALWYIVGFEKFSRSVRHSLICAEDEDRRIFSRLEPRGRVMLCRSDCIRTPMLIGVFRPLLILPDIEYTDKMLENILRHELTHYRRGDIAYKWFAVLIYSLHWFNPLMFLVRRELERDCELSCDEWLLRGMDIQDKKNYGETLLALADKRVLPRRVVATAFVTEKRNLKERLEQIMTYKRKGRATLALILAMLLLLAGCGTAVGPQSDASVQSASPTPAATASDGSTVVNVSTVDELLAAIAPNTTIVLADGIYDLSTASDYGKDGGEYYGWAEAYDGSQLNISGVKGLTLKAEDAEKVTIAAIPRYANVISFSACNDLTVSDLTLGHTEAPGQCVGGVLEFNSCDNVLIDDCALYGCGIIGVQAYDCRTVHTVDTDIYDCSIGAAYAEGCRDVLFDGCEVYDCTADFTGLFEFVSCNEVAVINSEIHDNTAQRLVCSSYTSGLYMAALEVSNNSFSTSVFSSTPNAITLEGCSLSGNTSAAWYGPYPYNDVESVMCVSPDGTELDDSALSAMKLSDDVTWTAKPQKLLSDDIKLEASEDGAIHVSSVDELLASIAPDTKIYLEDGIYNLSDASDYGTYADRYYNWGQSYDGPELLISGVDNLTIMAKSPELVTIAATPRYANVLRFSDCSNLLLSGFTAGHTEEPGSCSGGVLLFEGADKVRIENCSLFGCGIMGITASNCSDMYVTGTEIYDCSLGAVSASNVKGMSFTDCDIHDCATPEFSLNDCTDMSYDGSAIENGSYKMSDGKLAAWTEIDAIRSMSKNFGVTLGKELITVKYEDGSHAPVFDSMVYLSAGMDLTLELRSTDDDFKLLDASWTSSDPQKVSAEKTSDGGCIVKALANTEGVTLTATYGGVVYTVTAVVE